MAIAADVACQPKHRFYKKKVEICQHKKFFMVPVAPLGAICSTLFQQVGPVCLSLGLLFEHLNSILQLPADFGLDSSMPRGVSMGRRAMTIHAAASYSHQS